ncbi:hypothetical protein C445_01496 [Halobiforma lacisalsi AJ5]|uniref:Uncharacterized protein n=1 Tax=Natronobacterium lacisalsi AJ5 TaxID=358396 RepID=M0LZJ5_NATLA|nr:hypothetical protein C445_01496 [Halobiforma lacisalsi AJ5]
MHSLEFEFEFEFGDVAGSRSSLEGVRTGRSSSDRRCVPPAAFVTANVMRIHAPRNSHAAAGGGDIVGGRSRRAINLSNRNR